MELEESVAVVLHKQTHSAAISPIRVELAAQRARDRPPPRTAPSEHGHDACSDQRAQQQGIDALALLPRLFDPVRPVLEPLRVAAAPGPVVRAEPPGDIRA